MNAYKNYYSDLAKTFKDRIDRIFLSDLDSETKMNLINEVEMQRNRMVSNVANLRREVELPMDLPFPFSAMNEMMR